MVLRAERLTVEDEAFAHAVTLCREAAHVVCLTGAGISVESGIPDFRSPGGLWTTFDPKYIGIDAFHEEPEKAWELYRAIAETLAPARPNPAHEALARLETEGCLAAVITQNIDNLHQDAGSRNVLEVHGDNRHLQCLGCDTLCPATEAHWHGADLPRCAVCGHVLKPNVVLFGEAVRQLGEIQETLARCDLLLVVGTSAQVQPVASLPALVRSQGGRIIEFNLEETPLTRGSDSLVGVLFGLPREGITEVFVQGSASNTLAAFAGAVLA